MPRCQVKNNALTTLAAAYTNTVSTSFTVASGKGSLFGTPSGASPVRFVAIKASAFNSAGQLIDLAKYAIFRSTSRTDDVLSGLTLESGTAQDFAIGDHIGILVFEAAITEINADLATAEANIVANTAAILLRALDSAVVHNTGNETVAGVKTFSSTIAGSVSGNAASITGSIATSQVTGLDAALLLLAPKASPVFTGQVTAPTVQGSTAASGNLILQSTSDATKGDVTVSGGRFRVGSVSTDAQFQAIAHSFIAAVQVATQKTAYIQSNGSFGFNVFDYTAAVGVDFTVGMHGQNVQIAGGNGKAGINTAAPIERLSVGTGGALGFQASSSTTPDQAQAKIAPAWSTSTHASRLGDLILSTSGFNGEHEGMRFKDTGAISQPVIPLANVREAADDAAAAALSPAVPLGGFYRTGSILKIRTA